VDRLTKWAHGAYFIKILSTEIAAILPAFQAKPFVRPPQGQKSMEIQEKT
jgi:hypothetical protein